MNPQTHYFLAISNFISIHALEDTYNHPMSVVEIHHDSSSRHHLLTPRLVMSPW